MPYLSRIYLNPLRRHTQTLLTNPQALHAAILGGISRQPVTERVLWRAETDQRHRASVLILTSTRPSWEHLIEQAGWPGSDEPQAVVRAYEPLLEQVALGRQFALRLRANTISSTKQPDAPSIQQKEMLAASPRSRGVRVPHRTVAHQLTWFIERVPNWGFSLTTADHDFPAVRLVARERLQFTKRRIDEQNPRRCVTLQTATFDALVTVDDPEQAKRSLLDGVGAGKAYGLGLITLAPNSRPGPH